MRKNVSLFLAFLFRCDRRLCDGERGRHKTIVNRHCIWKENCLRIGFWVFFRFDGWKSISLDCLLDCGGQMGRNCLLEIKCLAIRSVSVRLHWALEKFQSIQKLLEKFHFTIDRRHLNFSQHRQTIDLIPNYPHSLQLIIIFYEFKFNVILNKSMLHQTI